MAGYSVHIRLGSKRQKIDKHSSFLRTRLNYFCRKSFIAQAQDFDANKTDKEIVVKFGRQWPRRHDT
jgi:hypothetical protein